jgi:recombinational DNA repair protein (RecF pathway)
MLRLAGVFPDFFTCARCSRQLSLEDVRNLAPGLQAVICEACEHRDAVSVHPDIPAVLHWFLKNRLDGEAASSALAGCERGTKSLRELNQYWIRHYFER